VPCVGVRRVVPLRIDRRDELRDSIVVSLTTPLAPRTAEPFGRVQPDRAGVTLDSQFASGRVRIRSAWVAEDDPHSVIEAVICEWDRVAAVGQVLSVEFGGRNSAADGVRVLDGDLVR